jgi:hypothetical protein
MLYGKVGGRVDGEPPLLHEEALSREGDRKEA